VSMLAARAEYLLYNKPSHRSLREASHKVASMSRIFSRVLNLFVRSSFSGSNRSDFGRRVLDHTQRPSVHLSSAARQRSIRRSFKPICSCINI